MQKNIRRRLAVVSGVIVIVVIAVLAIVAGGSAAKSITVAEAASGAHVGKKVQVSGNVVPGSFTITTRAITFSVYDSAEGAGSATVPVMYEGAVSATFGNDVSAIVTGRLESDGVLYATQLVTKCPSKYESGVDALTVARTLEYGNQILDKPVKVAATLVPGTLSLPGTGVRFTLADGTDSSPALKVHFDGALPDAVADGIALVVTGSMGADGIFHATDVALSA